MVLLDDIQIRDPFVVADEATRTYHLFGSTDPDVWDGPGTGFDGYRSTDLVDWEGPIPAFRPPAAFWGHRCFWAPEVHRFEGGWFMLATFTSAAGARGTAVLRADEPAGPFTLWSDGPVTPEGWSCLDGTLYRDDAGPWLVFCHEFVTCGDGQICSLRLTDDLRAAIGEPHLLFRASEAPWARPVAGLVDVAAVPPPHLITDGPFLHRAPSGTLSILWSSFGVDGYALGVARSATGALMGPWIQDDEPIWGRDGGHGMLFRTFDGRLHLAIHRPNTTPHERAVFLPVDEELRAVVADH